MSDSQGLETSADCSPPDNTNSEPVASPFPEPTVSSENLEMLVIGFDENVKKKAMKDITKEGKMVCILTGHL